MDETIANHKNVISNFGMGFQFRCHVDWGVLVFVNWLLVTNELVEFEK